ncbi:blue light-inducible protein-like protein Bli-3 [Aureobasidium pullulans]|uniref:Blue light-inducible protein-like protein Bli-3 n=2 Tax=Aureobasidium pullulans TaxID=5580 RepID=A0A074XEG0_AURPU|nr:blue light-inducible protein-like protein Bli-3 [Aureobasidium pullulans EXF-150]THV71468.1 blue light-inducible protein-like protein Bli-3 [Aureobasidium pullulans]KEQ83793.1 blue light-inducible protein-like protein Bli-3 [Aureobasidium pullulans EXF-150]THW19343.1 blue light-inducible protein-like protein Bli-3 [Aureobasidium pullulans]THW28024.1 blue light-inducible protein-like protein Bli-3 [Aureobasidium pullulans]THY01113.1 blue light-inducible protein-like protein Bli-3 [Aureobasid
MPSDVKQSDITEKNDPSVARQWDNNVDFETKFQEFYKIVDGLKIGLLGTYRPGIGPVTRSMALAKRTGPDFLFLANAHSQKFKDIEANKEVNVSFQDTKSQDWISVSGTATTASNSDPRIKEVWSRGAAAWFGDVGDGVHDGSAEDPRMSLIEVKAKYISYYKTNVGALGYLKEVVAANVTGGVANTGSLREMKEDEITKARSQHSSMSS